MRPGHPPTSQQFPATTARTADRVAAASSGRPSHEDRLLRLQPKQIRFAKRKEGHRHCQQQQQSQRKAKLLEEDKSFSQEKQIDIFFVLF